MFALGQDEPIERDEFAKEEEVKVVKPKEVWIAAPRTTEAKNFLSNVWQIMIMRFEEKWKPKEIGKLFHFRPEKLHEFINHYIIGVEDWYEKQVMKA